jgi:nucleotide-binding universal stress UspA family protein
VKTLRIATPASLSEAVADCLFAKILLAIDFGPASLGAARWATTHLALHGDAVLAHVVPGEDDPALGDGEGDGESFRGISPAVTGGLGGFAATLDVAAAENVVRLGRPSSCLADVANDSDASLLVLGRRGDANRIRVGEPNVIERVARRTRASVLVVPEGTIRAPEHVVAAVDESPFAEHVLRVAGRLARLHEIPLTILHVLSPVAGAYQRVIRTAKQVVGGGTDRPSRSSLSPAVPPAVSPRKTRWLLELGRAHDVVGRDSTEVAMGDPTREITNTATERDAALIVVGARGSDQAPERSLGSVARELLTRAPVPVLAINRPA